MHRLTVTSRPCRHRREAGTQWLPTWVPAFAGMTMGIAGMTMANREDDTGNSRG